MEEITRHQMQTVIEAWKLHKKTNFILVHKMNNLPENSSYKTRLGMFNVYSLYFLINNLI